MAGTEDKGPYLGMLKGLLQRRGAREAGVLSWAFLEA